MFPSFDQFRARAIAWQKQHEVEQLLHFYIPSDCSPSMSYASRHVVHQVVEDFLSHAEQKILLILGEAGLGKTSLTLKLERDYWKSTEINEEKYLPIRIELRSYNTTNVQRCIEDTLKKKYEFSETEIQGLKKANHIKLLMIFDGYDEIGGHADFNLYEEVSLSDWPTAKALVTCRNQHFTDDKQFKHCFSLHDASAISIDNSLRKIYLAPFTEEQIEAYLNRYASEQPYIKTETPFPLDNIQSLLKTQTSFKELLSNPFVLKIFVDVASHLLVGNERSDKIERSEIYQAFVEQWFQRAKARLETSVRGKALEHKPKDIEKYFLGYAQRLAFHYFKLGITELKYESESSEWEEYEEYRVIDEGQKAFKEFFGDDDEKVREARIACPLRRSDNQVYSFVHKSFQDYLAARHLYLVLKTKDEARILEIWNHRFLTEERLVLEFLGEIVGQDADKEALEAILLKVVKQSKEDERIKTASSNAISILNFNKYCFSALDLEGIRVPQSYLSNGNFYGTNLRGAELKDSEAMNIQLAHADLRSSDLRGIFFGELPYWKHENWVNCLAFNGRGDLLASGDEKGYLRLFRYPSGECIWEWRGHGEAVWSVAGSSDGEHVVSGGQNMMIHLWSISKRTLLHTFKGHTDTVTRVALSVDGEHIVSGSWDKTIRLWSLSKRTLLHTFEGHTGGVTSVALSVDGKHMVSGSRDNTIRLWSLSKRALLRTFEGHQWGVGSVALSADGEHMVSGGEYKDKTIRLWSLSKRKLLHTFEEHTERVKSVVLSADGEHMVSGSEDKTIRLWSVSKCLLLHVFEGHTDEVTSVALSADGAHLVSGSYDKTIRLWPLSKRRLLHTFEGHTSGVSSVAFSSGGEHVVSGSKDNTILLWSISKRALLHTFEGHTGGVMSVALSVDGEHMVSGSHDKTIRLWSLSKRALLHVFEGHTDTVTRVALSVDGEHMVSGNFGSTRFSRIGDNTIRLWSLSKRTLLHKFEGHTDVVTSVALSVDGEHMVSGSLDSTIRLWSLSKRALLHVFEGHTDTVTRVALSADGEHMVSGGADKTIRLWSLSKRTLLHTFEGHSRGVVGFTLSSDEEHLAIGGYDKTIRFWSIKHKTCLKVLAGFNGSINSIALHSSPHSPYFYLAVGSWDKGVYVFKHMDSELTSKSKFQLILKTQAYLKFDEAQIDDIQIDEVNRRLLEQRGARVGRSSQEASLPGPSLQIESSQSGIPESLMVEQDQLQLRRALLRLTECPDIVSELNSFQRVSLQSLGIYPLKQPWQLLVWPEGETEAKQLYEQLIDDRNPKRIQKNNPLVESLNYFILDLKKRIQKAIQEDKYPAQFIESLNTLLKYYEQYQQRLLNQDIAERKEALEPKASMLIPGHGWYYLKQESGHAVFHNDISENTGSSKITYYGGIHFKFRSKKPGLEQAVHRLDKILFSKPVTNPSYLIKLKSPGLLWQSSQPSGVIQRVPEEVLATQTVEGKTVDKYLSIHSEITDLRLPSANFSQQFILQALTNPGDGKLDNFIMSKLQELIGIDNEMVFEPMVVELLTGNHTSYISSMVFLLSQMDEPFDDEIRVQILSMNVPYLLLKWLDELEQENKRYAELMREGVFAASTLSNKGLPLHLVPGTMKTLYQKLTLLQRLLQQDVAKNMTPREILKALMSEVSEFYAKISERFKDKILAEQVHQFQKGKIPGQAWTFEALGVRLNSKTSITTEEAIHKSRHDKGPMGTMELARQSIIEAQEELLSTINFEMTVYSMKEFLKQETLSCSKQFTRLCFKNCRELTDEYIEALNNWSHLAYLEIEGENTISLDGIERLLLRHGEMSVCLSGLSTQGLNNLEGWKKLYQSALLKQFYLRIDADTIVPMKSLQNVNEHVGQGERILSEVRIKIQSLDSKNNRNQEENSELAKLKNQLAYYEALKAFMFTLQGSEVSTKRPSSSAQKKKKQIISPQHEISSSISSTAEQQFFTPSPAPKIDSSSKKDRKKKTKKESHDPDTTKEKCMMM